MLQNASNPDATIFQRPIEELLSAEGIGTATDIGEFTRVDDSYDSSQLLYAGYFLVETPLVGALSLAGGLRAEVLSQKVESRSPFGGQPASDIKRTDRTDTDYLPGAALRYQLTPGMLLRGAYGLTVARPQIRELAPFRFYDFLRDRNIVGNPDLERTLIHNADLRWEWFFDEGQVVAASVFYKRFTNPIELTILDILSGESRFENGSRAQSVGAELELRLNLERVARGLRWFNLDTNLALIRSRIELPPELARVVRGVRPLAGQGRDGLRLRDSAAPLHSGEPIREDHVNPRGREHAGVVVDRSSLRIDVDTRPVKHWHGAGLT